MSTAANAVAAQLNAARNAAARKPQTPPWPNLSMAMTVAAQELMNRRLPDPNKFRVRPHIFYHRVDYPSAGTAAQLQFFNVQPAQFITNLNGAQGLPSDTFFRMDSVRIAFEPGTTSSATYSALAATALSTAGVSTNTVAPIVELLRLIIQGGAVTLKIGDFVAIDGIYSLSRFPMGPTGLAGSVGFSTNSATTLKTDVALVANGDGSVDGVYSFPYGFPVLPGKQISGFLQWQAALALGAVCPIRYELCGQLLSPANL